MKKLFFLLSISGLLFAAEKPVSAKFLYSMLNLDTDDFLQMLKVSPNTVDLVTEEGGDTLLLLAISQGKNEKLKILLNGQLQRVPISAVTNKSGMNALHYAALRANVYAAQEIIRTQVDAKQADEMGRTPLHCLLKSVEKAHEVLNVAETILGGNYKAKYGCALLTIEDKSKETPVDVALKCNNMPAICLFLNICNQSTFGQPCPFEEIKKTIKTKILAHFKKEDKLTELIEFSASTLREWNKEKEKMKDELDKKEQELKTIQKKTKP